MDMNERVMRQDDYVELLEKIRKVDILAMKQDVEEHFAALDVGADLVEELVKNVFIKQVLVIEDHQRRQSEGFTIVEVLDACNAAVIDEVLDFINTQVTVTADNSEVVKAILDSLAPGAKVSPEDLETTTLVVRPAVVSLEELAGPNGAEALRRVSEQATINGLLEAGAIPLGIIGQPGGREMATAGEVVNITTDFSNQSSMAKSEGEVKMVSNVFGSMLASAAVAREKSKEHFEQVKKDDENLEQVKGDPNYHHLSGTLSAVLGKH